MAELGFFPSRRPVPHLNGSSKGSGKQIGATVEPWSPEAGNSRDSLGAHTALGGNHAESC